MSNSVVKPMEGHPLGIVCTRGIHAEEVVYSPDRLRFPMKRVGNRGEGRVERISWEEAIEISARLMKGVVERDGPESRAIYSGRGGFEQSLLDMFPTGGYDTICSNFVFTLGSPNSFSCSSLCNNSHRVIAPVVTFGTSFDRLFPDFDKLVEPKVEIRRCRDPHDDMFLEAAVSGAADRLVTGDKDLLDMGSMEGVAIVTARRIADEVE